MRARKLLIASPLLVSGCLSPMRALAHLEEQAAARATERPDDPVGDALENLAALADSSGLDPFERAHAVAVACEFGRSDPSRIVRARAFETTASLLAASPAPAFRFEVRPVDEAGLNGELDALIALAQADEAGQDSILMERGSDLERGARALAEQRPERLELARKLLLVSSRCGRIADEFDGEGGPRAALETAARTLSSHVAFLAARADLAEGRGLADPTAEVRIAAGRLLVVVDPIDATVELGKLWPRTGDPLVRVAWLQELAGSKLAAVAVHPTLRGPLALELESGDAAVEWWAKKALAALLALDPEKSDVAVIRGRWLALGEWDSQARS